MTASVATAGMRITAAWLNLNIPGSWTAITPLNGWSNSGSGLISFQARKLNSVTLQVVGDIVGGTITASTVLGVIPSSLGWPINNQAGRGVIMTATSFGTEFGMGVNSSGQIDLVNSLPSGAGRINFDFLVTLDG